MTTLVIYLFGFLSGYAAALAVACFAIIAERRRRLQPPWKRKPEYRIPVGVLDETWPFPKPEDD